MTQYSPYLAELRETLDSVLYQFGQVDAAAARWLAHNAGLREDVTSTREDWDRNGYAQRLQSSGIEQRLMFDALEAMLAAWARVSLLIFPLAGRDELSDFRRGRGEQIQAYLGLDEQHLLNDRDLRDSWMHFDERLDRAVNDGTLGSRQRFCLSSEAMRSKESVIRLLEVDTLVVHFRARDGSLRSVALSDMRAAAEDVAKKLSAAWEAHRRAVRSLSPSAG